ncbi:MAG: hypothetical protein JRC99_00110 [Deltaproteobacteria bacterium]|nr:hypothetical protein [Deltaproteobacteria bacterium]
MKTEGQKISLLILCAYRLTRDYNFWAETGRDGEEREEWCGACQQSITGYGHAEVCPFAMLKSTLEDIMEDNKSFEVQADPTLATLTEEERWAWIDELASEENTLDTITPLKPTFKFSDINFAAMQYKTEILTNALEGLSIIGRYPNPGLCAKMTPEDTAIIDNEELSGEELSLVRAHRRKKAYENLVEEQLTMMLMTANQIDSGEIESWSDFVDMHDGEDMSHAKTCYQGAQRLLDLGRELLKDRLYGKY